MAVTVVSAVTVTVQEFVPVQLLPLQPVNVEPGSAAAVSRTCVPLLRTSEQTPPHEIVPGGETVPVTLPLPVPETTVPVTVPLPVPALFTVRRNVRS